jgi:probable HAF family extracellular repeat protein
LFTKVVEESESESGTPYFSHHFISSRDSSTDVRVTTPWTGGYQLADPDGGTVTFRGYQHTTIQGEQAAIFQQNSKGQAIAQIYGKGPGNVQGSEWRPVIVQGDQVTEMLPARPRGSYLIYTVGINEAGTFVGNGSYATQERSSEWPWDDGRRESAFLYEDGAVRFLGTLPGMARSEATDINDKGQVIGNTIPWMGNMADGRGFLYEDGLMHDLDKLIEPESKGEWIITQALGIGDAGHIAAIGVLPGGSYGSGFVVSLLLLTPLDGSDSEPPAGTPIPVPTDPIPVPEPGPIALLSLVGIGLTLRGRVRHTRLARLGRSKQA